MDPVLRRVELLKLEGLGFSQGEIVKELSRKAECSERTIYNDFETRTQWQPTLQCIVKPEEVLLKIVNRYDQIYRQASRRLITSPNEYVQISALKVMMHANSLMFDTAVLPQLLARLRVLEQKAERGVFIP
jgi:transcriptional antiterminator